MRFGGFVVCFWTGVRMRCLFPRLNSYNLTMQSQQMKKRMNGQTHLHREAVGRVDFALQTPPSLGRSENSLYLVEIAGRLIEYR